MHFSDKLDDSTTTCLPDYVSGGSWDLRRMSHMGCEALPVQLSYALLCFQSSIKPSPNKQTNKQTNKQSINQSIDPKDMLTVNE
jgi:hypothetical protein